MATIDSTGATVKTLNEYLSDIRDAYRAIDAAWNLEPESPDGMATEIWAELLANLSEAIIRAYNAVDPATAVGQQLDNLARISAVTRQVATFSTATVTFSGTDGTQIPAGTEVRNEETDTLWATDTTVSISGGTATVNVTANEPGPVVAGIGDLSVIATPIAGISSVNNDDAAALGDDEESDAELRRRRDRSVSLPGSNQVDSIVGFVANVENVNNVRVYENFTGSTDSNGLNPHSIAAFVNGGTDEDVASAIARKKNPGTNLNADNSLPNKIQVDTETEQGSDITITFFRPELVTAFVSVEAEGDISNDTAEEIKQAIVDYSVGELFGNGSQSFDRVGFGIGEKVNAGKLYTPVNRVIGQSGAATLIELGTDSGNVTLQSIDPGFNGLVVFDAANITVSVT